MTISLTIDCADATEVGSFWAEALRRPLADGADATFASIPAGDGGEPALSFVQVPEGKTVKNRVHLDVSVGDRDAEVTRLVGLGGRVVASYDTWTTMADVEGNEFCVV